MRRHELTDAQWRKRSPLLRARTADSPSEAIGLHQCRRLDREDRSTMALLAREIRTREDRVQRSDDEGGSPLGALVLALVAPIAANGDSARDLSRARAHHADVSGAAFIRDPDALAPALEKLDMGNRRVHSHAVAYDPFPSSLFICSPASGRSIASWFSIDPPMAERVRRLRAMR